MTAVEWAYTGGPVDACLALARQALEGGELVAMDPGLLGTVAMIVLTLADADDAAVAWESARADAHRRGSLLGSSAINQWSGFALYRRGELDAAERLVRGSGDQVVEWGYSADARSYFAMFLVVIMIERGDRDGARAAAELLPDTAGIRSEALRYNWYARLELALAEDDPELALIAAGATARLEGRFTSTPSLPWRSLAALAHDRLGRTEQALELALRVSWSWRAAGARRGGWAARCGSSARSNASGGWNGCARRSRCWRAAARGWSRRRRCSPLAARCDAGASRRRRAIHCGGRWSWRAPARRPASPSRRAASCTRPAHARALTRSPASRR